jgi:Mrp family chromosome partitioning ATPase
LAAVDVLPCGSGHIAIKHLTAPELNRLLSWFRSRYDVVLLDAPSLLKSNEAFLFAPQVDQIVLSVVAGRTRVTQAQRAKDLLEMLASKAAGVVVNRSA